MTQSQAWRIPDVSDTARDVAEVKDEKSQKQAELRSASPSKPERWQQIKRQSSV